MLLIAAALAGGGIHLALAAPHHASSPHATHAAAGPTELGRFADWTAARYQHDGQTVCYAFTRARSAQPASGTAPLLTVTERPASRDEVAITNNAPYPKGASVIMQVGQTGLDFYTASSDAFARDGKATVAALRHGSQAIARGPGTATARQTDVFSLQGFAPALEAILKACPARS
ncbi:MAG TPA: hypothetical protein VJ779_20210 [Acetobacteraceae bacterium]|nr:hypothetical protein [Acetobacteraceae bacterium]